MAAVPRPGEDIFDLGQVETAVIATIAVGASTAWASAEVRERRRASAPAVPTRRPLRPMTRTPERLTPVVARALDPLVDMVTPRTGGPGRPVGRPPSLPCSRPSRLARTPRVIVEHFSRPNAMCARSSADAAGSPATTDASPTSRPSPKAVRLSDPRQGPGAPTSAGRRAPPRRCQPRSVAQIAVQADAAYTLSSRPWTHWSNVPATTRRGNDDRIAAIRKCFFRCGAPGNRNACLPTTM